MTNRNGEPFFIDTHRTKTNIFFTMDYRVKPLKICQHIVNISSTHLKTWKNNRARPQSLITRCWWQNTLNQTHNNTNRPTNRIDKPFLANVPGKPSRQIVPTNRRDKLYQQTVPMNRIKWPYWQPVPTNRPWQTVPTNRSWQTIPTNRTNKQANNIKPYKCNEIKPGEGL